MPFVVLGPYIRPCCNQHCHQSCCYIGILIVSCCMQRLPSIFGFGLHFRPCCKQCCHGRCGCISVLIDSSGIMQRLHPVIVLGPHICSRCDQRCHQSCCCLGTPIVASCYVQRLPSIFGFGSHICGSCLKRPHCRCCTIRIGVASCSVQRLHSIAVLGSHIRPCRQEGLHCCRHRRCVWVSGCGPLQWGPPLTLPGVGVCPSLQGCVDGDQTAFLARKLDCSEEGGLQQAAQGVLVRPRAGDLAGWLAPRGWRGGTTTLAHLSLCCCSCARRHRLTSARGSREIKKRARKALELTQFIAAGLRRVPPMAVAAAAAAHHKATAVHLPLLTHLFGRHPYE